MKIVIEEVKNKETEVMQIKVDSEGEVTDEFIFHSVIALISALENNRHYKKKSIIQAISKAVFEESEKSEESGEPINEVESSID